MKTPFFNSPDRIEALHRETERWIGTPFMANSASCGLDGGVSCHGLPIAIYKNIGALPADFEMPIGSPTGTRHKLTGVMEPFLDSCPHLMTVSVPFDRRQAGDLLGFQIFKCVDHLGILLEPGHGKKFIDVLIHKHVSINNLGDATYGSRLRRVWRVMI